MEVILGEGRHWFSRAIMKVIGYPISHTALRYPEPEDRWLVHSTIGGVNPIWWSEFITRYVSVKRYKAKFGVGARALDLVLGEIGLKGYDYTAIVGLLIAIKLKLDKNPLGMPNRFMCTEVIVRWLRKCEELDVRLKFEDFDENMTDPKMIDEFLQRSEWFELID